MFVFFSIDTNRLYTSRNINRNFRWLLSWVSCMDESHDSHERIIIPKKYLRYWNTNNIYDTSIWYRLIHKKAKELVETCRVLFCTIEYYESPSGDEEWVRTKRIRTKAIISDGRNGYFCRKCTKNCRELPLERGVSPDNQEHLRGNLSQNIYEKRRNLSEQTNLKLEYMDSARRSVSLM